MMCRSLSWLVIGLTFSALGLLGQIVPSALAQNRVGLPVAVHPGTCAQPVAEPRYELGDLRRLEERDDEETAIEYHLVPASELQVGALVTEVDASLDDIVSAPHVIIVHSAADFSQYLACGEINGFANDDAAIVPLRQLNESGHLGIAVLESDDGVPFIDDDEIDITIYLF